MWLVDQGGKGKSMAQIKDEYYEWRDETAYHEIPANNKIGRRNKLCDIIDRGGPTAHLQFTAAEQEEIVDAGNEAAEEVAAITLQRSVRGFLGRKIVRKRRAALKISDAIMSRLRKLVGVSFKKMGDAVASEKEAREKFKGLASSKMKLRVDQILKAATDDRKKREARDKLANLAKKAYGPLLAKTALKENAIDKIKDLASRVATTASIKQMGKALLVLNEIGMQRRAPCEMNEEAYSMLERNFSIDRSQFDSDFDVCTYLKVAMKLPKNIRVENVIGHGQAALVLSCSRGNEKLVSRLNVLGEENETLINRGRYGGAWNMTSEVDFIIGYDVQKQVYDRMMTIPNITRYNVLVPKPEDKFTTSFGPVTRGGRIVGPPRKVGVTIMEIAGQYTFDHFIRNYGPAQLRTSQQFYDKMLNDMMYDLGKVIRKLNDNGVYHGDCHLDNLMISPSRSGGKPKLYIIDFERTLLFDRISLEEVPKVVRFYDIKFLLASVWKLRKKNYDGSGPVLTVPRATKLVIELQKGYMSDGDIVHDGFTYKKTPNQHSELFRTRYWGDLEPRGKEPRVGTAEWNEWRFSHIYEEFSTVLTMCHERKRIAIRNLRR
jgi:hypothetical protein